VQAAVWERLSRVNLGASQPLLYQVALGGCAPPPRVEACLSRSEIARANAFCSAHLRSRFVWCRAALRQILGRRLDCLPARVALRTTATGRPFVAAAALDFNVSHCEDLALIAVLPAAQCVGVDVEYLAPLPDLMDLARIVLIPREIAQLPGTGDAQLQAFYRFWTCKEAYLKAIGTGLSCEPRRVELSFTDPTHPTLGCALDPRSFAITSFCPMPGFIAALAISS
jgi:4'-phosphopantetheinyl transferase